MLNNDLNHFEYNDMLINQLVMNVIIDLNKMDYFVILL